MNVVTELAELKFATKEEYISWTKRWRKTYEEISLSIRDTKSRRPQYAWSKQNKSWVKQGPNPRYDSNADYDLHRQRLKALKMMEIRAEAKEKCAASRQAANA